MSQSLVVRVMQAPDGADLFVFFSITRCDVPFFPSQNCSIQKKKKPAGSCRLIQRLITTI